MKINQFAKLTEQEKQWIWLIADRWQRWAADWRKANARDDLVDPDIHLLAMDVAVTHLSKPLNLFQWFLSSDLEFIGDAITIAKNIDRPNACFPVSVRLRFQRDD